MRLNVIFLALICTVLLQANTFKGDGYGMSHKEAKKESLADLSYAIKSEVKSSFSSHATSTGDKASQKELRVSSDLPIIGSEFELSAFGSGYKALSKLDTAKAKPLYEGKLESLRKEIDILVVKVASQSKSDQFRTYSQMLTLLDNYDRYRSVAYVIGIKDITEPKMRSSEVKLKLARLSQSFESLNQAVAFLLKDIKQDNLFIFPLKAESSNEITSFAKVVKKMMQKHLQTSRDKKSASAIVKGNYIADEKGMTLSVSVIDSEQKVLFANVVHLDKVAFEKYSYEPKSIDFDKLLHEGYITKSSFQARIKTDVGDEDLLFVRGDEVKLFVKLNNPGYFYLVGHVDQKGKKFSYLLDLSEVEGQTKFVQYVGLEEANKWMLLGEFEIEPPFGIESMQLIASNKEIKKLPEAYYDEDSGYHILGKDPKKVALATRGLKKKKSKTAKVSEAVLMFTTMEK